MVKLRIGPFEQYASTVSQQSERESCHFDKTEWRVVLFYLNYVLMDIQKLYLIWIWQLLP